MKSFTVETFVVGSMHENTYVITNSGTPQRSSFIIDPGDDWEHISQHVASLGCHPIAILLTHGHFDHVMASFPLSRLFEIPVFMHVCDRFLLKRLASTAKKFIGKHIDDIPAPDTQPYDVSFLRTAFGSGDVDVIETPGHTPGSVSVRIGQNLFSGDTMFADGVVGRTDFSYGDRQALQKSIQTLLSLPSELHVYPGHGEETSIGQEQVFHTLLEKVE